MSITSMEDLKNKQAEVKKNLDGYTCRVLVCSGTGCIASGAQKIYEEMSRLCEGIEGVAVEMQKDVPHVGIVKTGCQGLCELGPLMRIERKLIYFFSCKLTITSFHSMDFFN